MRNYLDAHLGQIVCDKDGDVDLCIIRVEMPLTRFEECWPLPKESLPELPWKLNIETLTLILWPINSCVLTSLLLPHLSSSLTDSLPSLNLLCHSKTDARFMQDGRKAVWSIPYVVSVAFFPSLKQNFIAYRSSKRTKFTTIKIIENKTLDCITAIIETHWLQMDLVSNRMTLLWKRIDRYGVTCIHLNKKINKPRSHC